MKAQYPWLEAAEWSNPVRSAPIQPHLGEIIFPADSTSSSSDAKQAADRLLRQFYCPTRDKAANDLASLDAFVNFPDKQLFIIEGDVGVGKTWFLRYTLLINPRTKSSSRFGVIDFLHMPPGRVRDALYRDLVPILEDYFRHTIGSAKAALHCYALHQYASRVGGDHVNPTAEMKEGACIIAERWLTGHGEQYVEVLLAALEVLPGPYLFIILDNLDRTPPADQGDLLDVSIRVLRNHKIRLIAPLRRTSTHLRDRFQGLHEVRHQAMTLSRLDPAEMLKPRFCISCDGSSMEREPRIKDGNREYTYREIHALAFSGEAGELLRALVGHNARVALLCIQRLLHSDLLKGLHRLSNPQFVIAALMLAGDYEPDDGALIINLFDNEEHGRKGSALIRFRVLERLSTDGSIDLGQRSYLDYFESRGYEANRVKRVIARFLMADLVELTRNLTPDEVLNTPADQLDSIGLVKITPVGRIYVQMLLHKQWYFVSCKRGLVNSVSSRYKELDRNGKYQFMKHSHLIDFLRDEEAAERQRRQRWEAEHASRIEAHSDLKPPHLYAEQALLKRPDDDGE